MGFKQTYAHVFETNGYHSRKYFKWCHPRVKEEEELNYKSQTFFYIPFYAECMDFVST